MKNYDQMTTEEIAYFHANASEIAYIEVDQEIESRLALLEPRKFNENFVAYDDCEDESDEITEEDTRSGCKALQELIQ